MNIEYPELYEEKEHWRHTACAVCFIAMIFVLLTLFSCVYCLGIKNELKTYKNNCSIPVEKTTHE